MRNKNILSLKSINELYDYAFFIPDYQRGYRWTSTQVIQLLEDIWNFAKNPPVQKIGGTTPFYCLQPIVVKHHGDDEWEVIDGQQRLTTIVLVIHYFNEMWIGKKKIKEPKIIYETRKDSSDYISSIEISNNIEDVSKNIECLDETFDNIEVISGSFDAASNIDFFHMMNAYKAIHYWVSQKGSSLDYNKLQSVFQNNTKVIWYEVDEIGNDNSIDIFTRLNIGKIPLTNSELIKALFLMKGNFSVDKASLKQIQIATEWDLIENTLQNDAFWYFIYNPSSQSIKYDNRIEYIFDLMKGKTKHDEFYFTFNKFYSDFESETKNGKPDIEKIWLEVKKYFLTFDEWFKDYELYHYIGYLVDCGVPITILKKESLKLDKISFKNYLKKEISKQVDCNVDEVEFGNNAVKRILLLFNIITVLQTQKSDMRFPFYKYKNENWDIEHVCSQTDKEIKGEKKKKDWIADMLDYFVGSVDKETVVSFIKAHKEDKDLCDICQRLLDLLELRNAEFDLGFDALFSYIQSLFNESGNIENKDSICNLALLDSATNRSYGNSFFPIKRKRIIDNDSKGIFVPIATKNLFLKYYSKKSDNLMYWSKEDAEDYLNAIKSVLKDYLPNE